MNENQKEDECYEAEEPNVAAFVEELFEQESDESEISNRERQQEAVKINAFRRRQRNRAFDELPDKFCEIENRADQNQSNIFDPVIDISKENENPERDKVPDEVIDFAQFEFHRDCRIVLRPLFLVKEKVLC